MGIDKQLQSYMHISLELATQALENGEFPIAAIVVLDDQIIAQAIACEQFQRRFLVHAELLALIEADKLGLSLEQRRKACLYTNLEPCLMCMGAAMSIFLGEIVYALESPGDGAVELVTGWSRKEEHIPGYQVPKIIGGVLRQESQDLFKRYCSVHQKGAMHDWAESLTNL